MELVPIITEILVLVAAVFIFVLIVSFVVSKMKKKETDDLEHVNTANIRRVNRRHANGENVDKSQYYGGSNNNGNSITYPKGIKVVKRTSSSREFSSNKYEQAPTISNTRFTVLNNFPDETQQFKTDEYGFKVYTQDKIERPFYLPG